MIEREAYLVLDTNIWVYKTNLLTSSLGAALLYSLNRTLRVLAIPEVIEEEIRKNVKKRGMESVKDIQDGYGLIQRLMGSRDDYRVPSAEEFEKRIDLRAKELGAYRIEFTFAHAKGALQRILEELPPNGHKNQQFKDSAIWEAILDLAKDARSVDFVTEDKGFFEDKNPDLGLAKNLKADCEKVPGIKVYYSLDSYLETINQEVPPLYHEEIFHKMDLFIKLASRDVMRKGYDIGILLEHKSYFYRTENGNIIAIGFEFVYETHGVKHPETQQEIEAKALVKGDCFYRVLENRVEDMRFDNIQLVDATGKAIPEYDETFGRFEISIGRKNIPYTLREPLEV